MYKDKLFAYGAKHLMKSKGSLKPYKSRKSTATGGALNNLDNYLLSLVGQARRMSIASKHKKASKSGRGLKKSYGKGLKFVR